MFNVLGYDTKVSKFELKSRFYVHFRDNCGQKGEFLNWNMKHVYIVVKDNKLLSLKGFCLFLDKKETNFNFCQNIKSTHPSLITASPQEENNEIDN